jgi:hypothetical protein
MPASRFYAFAIFPILLAALIFQLGPLALVTQTIIKSVPLQWLAITGSTHCYASVKTLVSGAPHANCFRVANGRFSRVYFDEASAHLEASHAGHVMPGLWDGHGHLVQYGELLESANLFGAKSMREVQQRLVNYKARRPETGTREHWLRGIGWDQANFDGLWPKSVRFFIFFDSIEMS